MVMSTHVNQIGFFKAVITKQAKTPLLSGTLKKISQSKHRPNRVIYTK